MSVSLRRWVGIVLMMLFGGIVTTLYANTWPANMSGSDVLSDQGAIRMLIGYAALFLIPLYRSQPQALLIVGGINTALVLGDPYVLAIGLTVWMVRARERREWVVTCACIVGILTNAVVHWIALARWDAADAEFGTVILMAVVTGALAVPAIVATMVRSRRHVSRATAAVKESQMELDTELARQRERENLAREVHDTLATRLSSIALQAATINTPEAVTLQSNASKAMTDLRGILTSIRYGSTGEASSAVGSYGNQRDLVDVIEDAQASGLTVSPCLIVLNSYQDAPSELQQALHRFTREALTNALRHSNDQRMALSIQGGPGEGVAFAASNTYSDDQEYADGAHQGLIGLDEHARLLGGTIKTSRENGTFKLSISVPWPDEPAVE